MRVHGWLPCLTGLVTVVLTLLVILSGLNAHILSKFFFLKADTASLNVASKLSGSDFLRDLTALTKTDFIGQNASAKSLGLADSYTVSLLALCGENKTETACSSPQFGFHFKPGSDLKLDNSALQDTLPGAINNYSATSKFLSIGYVLAIFFAFLAPLVNLFSYSAGAALAAALMSTLATVLLLASSVASLVTFTNFSKAFNSALSPYGAKSHLGTTLFVISWVATAFSIATTMLLFRSHHGASRNGGRRGKSRAVEGEKGVEGEDPAPRKLRLLSRMPTWKMHEYRQIGKQQQAVQVQKVGGIRAGANDDDFDSLVRNVGMEGVDEEPDMEPSHGEGPHRGISMQVFNKNEPSKNIDAVYEPYRGAA
ncbi:hypothetical protein B7463_g5004, partial [Scytalidium lignicola]